MNYLGIDPGVSGGLALIAPNGTPVVVAKMPATRREIWECIRDMKDRGELTCMIERLGQMPRGQTPVHRTCNRCGNKSVTWESRGMQSPKTMLVMGKSYGGLLMALTGLEIPIDDVTPGRWQQVFGLVFKGKNLTSTEKKNKHKEKAECLFPSVTVIHANADALLIAEYARRLLLTGKPF